MNKRAGNKKLSEVLALLLIITLAISSLGMMPAPDGASNIGELKMENGEDDGVSEPESMSLLGGEMISTLENDENFLVNGGSFTNSPHATLSEAVDAINNDGGSDIAYTITAKANDSLSAALTINSGKIVTLTSEGTAKTITQLTFGRHFRVSGSLTLQNIILDGGSTGSDGGGVYVTGGSLTIETGTIIRNCSLVESMVGYGGGVYIHNGTFTMSGGTISGNAARYGGGVYLSSSGTMNVTGSVSLTDNNANYDGGGIYVEDATYTNLNLTDGNITFSGNTAQAAYEPPTYPSQTLDVTFTQTSVFDHPLNNYDINYTRSTSYINPTLYSVSYDANGASGTLPAPERYYPNGYDLVVLGNTNNLTKDGFSFAGWNTEATGSGDAYQPADAISMSADITLYAQWTPDNFLVNGGSFTNSPYGTLTAAVNAINNDGGSDIAYTITTKADDSLDSQLTINSGKTVTLTSEGTAKTITQPTSGRHFRVYGSLTLQNIILDGVSTGSDGGGVFVSGGGLTIETGTVIQNCGLVDSLASGGGVWVNSGTFTMSGGTITGNAAGLGGGVSINNSTFTMSGGTISSNTADNGGGVCLAIDSTMKVTGSVSLTDNNANENGGGIYTENAVYTNLDLTDGNITFSGNTAQAAYEPPTYPSQTLDVTFTQTSVFDHPLNNYDINYTGGTPYTNPTLYSVSYDANGGIGTLPAPDRYYPNNYDLVVLGNTNNLTKDGFSFAGWNTEATGSGDAYQQEDTISMSADIVLYAQWIAIPVSTVPGIPENVSATPGDGQITLDWEAPASDGNSPIIGYEVSSDNSNWTNVGMTYTYTFSGLTNNTQYTLSVRALNAIGSSDSASVSAVPISNRPVSPTYTFTVAFGTYTGQADGLKGTTDGPFIKFSYLMIANVTVDTANYDIAEGSTIITLKASYLDTLDNGTYTLRAVFTDGYVDTTFTVNKSHTLTPATQSVTNLTQTGDANTVWLWITLALISVSGVVGVLVWKRRRKVTSPL